MLFYYFQSVFIFWACTHSVALFSPTESSFFPRERCFDDPPIGCFSTKAPFNNTLRLPHSPRFINVHYNHTILNDSAVFHWRDAREGIKTRFRPELRTVFIIHGFNGHGARGWVVRMVDALVNLRQRINVFVLDWERGSNVPNYPQALANGRVVSAMGALFVQDLISLGADPASFHLIGYSLGAHVAGGLAARVPGIGRITGIDPSRRKMEGFPPEVRLDPTDAIFVDVLHADGGAFGFGSVIPVGTVDFYANGGLDQPGCSNTFWELLRALYIKGIAKCSHYRSLEIFIETISTCVIMAGECSDIDNITKRRCTGCREGKSCVPYGYHLKPSSRLKKLYVFETNSKHPYCRN